MLTVQSMHQDAHNSYQVSFRSLALQRETFEKEKVSVGEQASLEACLVAAGQ